MARLYIVAAASSTTSRSSGRICFSPAIRWTLSSEIIGVSSLLASGASPASPTPSGSAFELRASELVFDASDDVLLASLKDRLVRLRWAPPARDATWRTRAPLVDDGTTVRPRPTTPVREDSMLRR